MQGPSRGGSGRGVQEGEHGVILPASLHAEGLHLLLGGLLDLVEAAVGPLPLVQEHDLIHPLQPLALGIQGLRDKGGGHGRGRGQSQGVSADR